MVPILGALGAPSAHLVWRVLVGYVQTSKFALAIDALLALLVLAYVAGTFRLVARHRCAWPVWRLFSLVCGATALFVALGSGLAAYEILNPSVHVLQHVLLMMVAPPLLVLGRPTVSLRALRIREGEPARVPLSHRWRRAIGFASWPLYYGTMGAYFLSPLYVDAIEDPVVLRVSQAAFVVVGCVFWYYLVGVDSGTRPSHAFRMGAVLIGMPVETAVGLALTLWPHPVAPGGSLTMTRTAGLALWLGSMLTSGVALATLLIQWAADDARAVPLDPAARDVTTLAPLYGAPGDAPSCPWQSSTGSRRT